MSLEEAERKLSQAMQLITEAGIALAETRKGQAPAQVMSRIQAAAARPQEASPPMMLVRGHSSATGKKAKGSERAHFYLHIWATNDVLNDRIYRVLGDGGLTEANRMQAELSKDPGWQTARLDSRTFNALVGARLKQVREGATMYVGTTGAEDLRGPQATVRS
jgi:hypothetical protein